MANNVNDPQWRQLIPVDVQGRIQSVIGISDGSRTSSWVLYAALDAGDYLTVRYDPRTSGTGLTVSDSTVSCEADLRRHGEGSRVGIG